MAELTQAEVYSPGWTLQVWRTLLNWLGFLFQIFLRILHGLGHHPLLSGSAPSFKRLPVVELPDIDPLPPVDASVDISPATESAADSAGRVEKLTVHFGGSLLSVEPDALLLAVDSAAMVLVLSLRTSYRY